MFSENIQQAKIILLMFLENCRKFSQEVNLLISKKNYDNLFRLAHQMKSNSKMMGTERIENFMKKLTEFTRTSVSFSLIKTLLNEFPALQEENENVILDFIFNRIENVDSTPLATKNMNEDSPKTRILLADDDPISLSLVSHILHHEGYVIETAINGEMAIKLINSFDYHLIISDIYMPFYDGYEVTHHLRKVKRSKIPIILTSNVEFTENFTKAFEYGANDYFQKPINPQELTSKVKKLLNML